MSTISNVGVNDTTKYEVALSTFLKFGPRRFSMLEKYFPNMQEAFYADAGSLQQAGITPAAAREFVVHRRGLDPDEEMAKLEREHIHAITRRDPRYPALLKEIYDAPPVLYGRGDWPANTALCLAVVGSRKYSAYGERVVNRLVGDCAQAGLSIVSGLALGIDTLAHQSALDRHGRTTAVLGSGVNHTAVYPATNRRLAERIIAQGGLILSEFSYGTPPFKHHFPQRNRVIAGLCSGTLVVEASAKSGALITARQALEAGRDVFAVPHDIFHPNAAGTNALIKNGALVAVCAQDILDGLGIADAKATAVARATLPQTQPEQDISALLKTETLHVNTLARALKLDTAVVNATLLTMELKGLVKNIGGGNYVLS